MEHNNRRRGRRGRGHSYATLSMPNHFIQRQGNTKNSFTSCLIMTSLIGIIYLMLEFHCTTCSKKCDMSNITRCLDEMTKNLRLMKENYSDLERKIAYHYMELPRMVGQIKVLEAFANSMEKKALEWKAESRSTLLPCVNMKNIKDPGCQNDTNVTNNIVSAVYPLSTEVTVSAPILVN